VYEAQAGLAVLLPAAVEWLRLASPQLAALAARETSRAYGDRPGPLCQQAGITEGGFTARRWDFWLTRLAEIAATGGETGDDAQRGLRYLLAARTFPAGAREPEKGLAARSGLGRPVRPG
jgi:hypothetical protein